MINIRRLKICQKVLIKYSLLATSLVLLLKGDGIEDAQ